MKKIVLIVLAVLVVAWLGATFLIGSGIEKGVQSFYDTTEARMGGGGDSPVTFSSGEIDRGFFTSEAITKLGVADVPIDELTLDVKTKIYHGPFMFTPNGFKVGSTYAYSTLDSDSLPAEVTRELDKAFDGEQPIEIGILFGFGGTMDSTAKVPSLRYTVEEEDGSETKLQFAGLNGEIHGSTSEDSPLKGSVTVGEFRMSNDAKQTTLKTEVGTGELDVTKVQNGMTLAGTSSLMFPEIKGSAPTGEYSFKDVGFKSESTFDPKTNAMGGFARMEFGSVSGTDETGMAAGLIEQLGKGGYLEATLEGWDVDALQTINEANSKMTKIQAEMTTAMMGEGEGAEDFDMEKAMEDIQAATGEMIDAVLGVFKPGMGFNVRAKLGDGEGRTDIQIGLGYAEGAKPATEAETIGEFVNGVTIDADVRLSKAMLPEGMGEAMLAAPVEQGMLEDRGDYYRGTAEMKESKISVNGNELPIMEQFAPIMEQELSMEGIMGAFMGMGGGMGGDEAGFPGDDPNMSPDGFDLPDDPNMSPDGLKPPSDPGAAPDALRQE